MRPVDSSNEAPALPRIETSRLLLTVLTPPDAPRMLEYAESNRQHFAPWDPVRPPEYYTEGFWTNALAASAETVRAGAALSLVLLDRKRPDAGLLGHCTYSNIARGPFQACHLGYGLAERAVGRGLMYEALSAANAYVFDVLKLHRIMANYMPANARSGRLLRRLNFVVEGYARDYLFLAGEWQDHILTSLTNPDYGK